MIDTIRVLENRLAEAHAVALTLNHPENLDGGLSEEAISRTLNVIIGLLDQAGQAFAAVAAERHTDPPGPSSKAAAPEAPSAQADRDHTLRSLKFGLDEVSERIRDADTLLNTILGNEVEALRTGTRSRGGL